jgi:hypothetical protein
MAALARTIQKLKSEWPDETRPAIAQRILIVLHIDAALLFRATLELLRAVMGVCGEMPLPGDDAELVGLFVASFAGAQEVDVLLAICTTLSAAVGLGDGGVLVELCRLMADREAIFAAYLEVCLPEIVELGSGVLDICTEAVFSDRFGEGVVMAFSRRRSTQGDQQSVCWPDSRE